MEKSTISGSGLLLNVGLAFRPILLGFGGGCVEILAIRRTCPTLDTILRKLIKPGLPAPTVLHFVPTCQLNPHLVNTVAS